MQVAIYWSADHPKHWVACLENGRWVEFPAEVNGWTKRQTAKSLDPQTLRRVPGSRAFNTGFPAVEETEDDLRRSGTDFLNQVA